MILVFLSLELLGRRGKIGSNEGLRLSHPALNNGFGSKIIARTESENQLLMIAESVHCALVNHHSYLLKHLETKRKKFIIMTSHLEACKACEATLDLGDGLTSRVGRAEELANITTVLK